MITKYTINRAKKALLESTDPFFADGDSNSDVAVPYDEISILLKHSGGVRVAYLFRGREVAVNDASISVRIGDKINLKDLRGLHGVRITPYTDSDVTEREVVKGGTQ